MSKHLRPVVLTYHCQFLLHGLSDHVGRGDVFNPQRRINGFMFFSLSVLNLEDHLGLVISPQSPLSAGYITLRACRRSLPLRFSTVTPGGIVGFLIVSYRSRKRTLPFFCRRVSRSPVLPYTGVLPGSQSTTQRSVVVVRDLSLRRSR
jgi:hypothetical protein